MWTDPKQARALRKLYCSFRYYNNCNIHPRLDWFTWWEYETETTCESRQALYVPALPVSLSVLRSDNNHQMTESTRKPPPINITRKYRPRPFVLIMLGHMAYLHRAWPGPGPGPGTVPGPGQLAHCILCWTFHTAVGPGTVPGTVSVPMAYQAILYLSWYSSTYLSRYICMDPSPGPGPIPLAVWKVQHNIGPGTVPGTVPT